MIQHHIATRSLHCTGCGANVEIARSTYGRPDTLMELIDRIANQHGDCDSYGDAVLARNAMRFERNRRRLLRELAMPTLQRAAD